MSKSLTLTPRVALACACLLLTACQQSPAYVSPPGRQYLTFTDANNVMLEGYDAVELYRQRKLIAADPSLSTTYHDGTYHFATAANREAFLADPERYAPLYGGFCGAGASVGNIVPTDVRTFSYVNDRLVLQKHAAAKAFWDEDVQGNYQRANQKWPGLAAGQGLQP